MVKNYERAQHVLDQTVSAQLLVDRLEAVKANSDKPYRIKSPKVKAAVRALCDEIQDQIDELSAQRENVLSLVQKIQHEELQQLLIFRYGLKEKRKSKRPWYEIEELLHCSAHTVFRWHEKALGEFELLMDADNKLVT